MPPVGVEPRSAPGEKQRHGEEVEWTTTQDAGEMTPRAADKKGDQECAGGGQRRKYGNEECAPDTLLTQIRHYV